MKSVRFFSRSEKAGINDYSDHIVASVRAGGYAESAYRKERGEVYSGDCAETELDHVEGFGLTDAAVLHSDVMVRAEQCSRDEDGKNDGAFV